MFKSYCHGCVPGLGVERCGVPLWLTGELKVHLEGRNASEGFIIDRV